MNQVTKPAATALHSAQVPHLSVAWVAEMLEEDPQGHLVLDAIVYKYSNQMLLFSGAAPERGVGGGDARKDPQGRCMANT